MAQVDANDITLNDVVAFLVEVAAIPSSGHCLVEPVLC